MEAGCKGFWRHYGNIDALAEELGISPFTPYTSSAFYSPKGKEVEAPVLGDLPRLPTPFGTLLYTSPYFTQLSVEDRISALPLALDLLKYNATVESYLEYDNKSARDVFLGDPTNGRLGASGRCTSSSSPRSCAPSCSPRPRSSQRPPRSTCCTATCWRTRTISTSAGAKEQSRRRSSRRGRRRCRRRAGRTCSSGAGGYRRWSSGNWARGRGSSSRNRRQLTRFLVYVEIYDADVVVMATGVGAARGIIASSPELRECPDLAGIKDVPSTDVVAVRLFLDKPVRLPNVSNVFAGFALGGDDAAVNVAGTFFDLCALHDEYANDRGGPTRRRSRGRRD